MPNMDQSKVQFPVFQMEQSAANPETNSNVRMIPLQLVIIITVFAFFLGMIGMALFCGRFVH